MKVYMLKQMLEMYDDDMEVFIDVAEDRAQKMKDFFNGSQTEHLYRGVVTIDNETGYPVLLINTYNDEEKKKFIEDLKLRKLKEILKINGK